MCWWSRGQNNLAVLLQRRIEVAPDDDRDWLVGLEVACAVQDMESALQRAGLDNGVEPAVRPIRP